MVMGNRGLFLFFASSIALPAGVTTLASAWASTAGPIWSPSDEARQGAGAREVRLLDADADGRLSRAEHAAGAQALFRALDADRDGLLRANEVDEALENTLGPAHEVPADERIAELDRDRDARLSAAEHAAVAREIFDRLDTDADGFLTSDELQRGHDEVLRRNLGRQFAASPRPAPLG
jgi:hypothetical protein